MDSANNEPEGPLHRAVFQEPDLTAGGDRIVATLVKYEVLSPEEGCILRQMAGYRNRMVHFQQEIGIEGLYIICRNDLVDIEQICNAFVNWIKLNPDKIDTAI